MRKSKAKLEDYAAHATSAAGDIEFMIKLGSVAYMYTTVRYARYCSALA